MPRVQHLRRALPREEEDAGVDVRDRVELELERRDDAEVPAGAPECPEELGLVAASTRRSSPSAVTSSIAVTLFVASPCLRPYQPTPPPSA